MRLVVFGGIGSGKSTFARLLAGLGAFFIDADRIGHEVLRPEGPAFDQVSARWPSVVVDGEIDRRALGAIVFGDPAELAILEEISHPLIAAEIARRAAAAGDQPVVVELPLTKQIIGPGWTWVLIDAPPELRLQRVLERGAEKPDVVARMGAQPKDAAWHERADWVIPNIGSLEELAVAAEELWKELMASTDPG